MEENRTIIAVDDENGALDGYRDFLSVPAPRDTIESVRLKKKSEEQKGDYFKCNLLTAISGEEAIEIVKNEILCGKRVACGFFDVVMPGGIDGIETIKRIRAIDPEILCTIVTAYQDRSLSDINRTVFPGKEDEWDYLNKPFNRGEVIQKARNMISSWNRRRREDALTKQAIHSERIITIGMLTSGIIHDLNNLLQVTEGQIPIVDMELTMLKKILADMANTYRDESSDLPNNLEIEINKLFISLERTIKDIHSGNKRIHELLKNLNLFSKGEVKEKIEYDVRDGLDSTIDLLSFKYKFGKKIELVKEYGKIPQIRCNPVEINQIFANLIGNACDAMKGEGWLHISTAFFGGKITVRISDSGGGISPEFKENLFKPFCTTKGTTGTGLGLFFSKKIANDHGGDILVENGERGAIFTVSFNV